MKKIPSALTGLKSAMGARKLFAFVLIGSAISLSLGSLAYGMGGFEWSGGPKITVHDTAYGDAYSAFQFESTSGYPFIFDGANVGVGTAAPAVPFELHRDLGGGTNVEEFPLAEFRRRANSYGVRLGYASRTTDKPAIGMVTAIGNDGGGSARLMLGTESQPYSAVIFPSGNVQFINGDSDTGFATDYGNKLTINGSFGFGGNEDIAPNSFSAKIFNSNALTGGSTGDLVFQTRQVSSAQASKKIGFVTGVDPQKMPLVRMAVGDEGVAIGDDHKNPEARLHVKSADSNDTTAIFESAADQNANMTEWKDSSQNVKFHIDSDGDAVLPTYTDSTRPAAGKAGRIIFNTDDAMINIDTGSIWVLPNGSAA